MNLPPRVSVMTFNLWGDEYLDSRAPNITFLFDTIQPDLLVVQEVTPRNLQLLHEILGRTHSSIDTISQSNITLSSSLDVWQKECHIFWNSSIFQFLDFGYESFQHEDYTFRGLFWVRLSLYEKSDQHFLLSTAHFPWVGSKSEITTGINQRIRCTKLVKEFLSKLRKNNEPIIFGGDLNDDYHPLEIFRQDYSSDDHTLQSQIIRLYDVFELLDLPPQITHPVRPSDLREEMRPSRTIDYILISTKCDTSNDENIPHEGIYFHPIAAFVKGIRGRWPPPSDHLPVITVLEFRYPINLLT